MAIETATIHASAVLVGRKAVLVRGASGAGKSRLVWELIEAASRGALPFARLVADDRAYLEAHGGRLIVRPAGRLAGLIEIRGLGVRRLPYEPAAAVGAVVDLAAADAGRMPSREAGCVEIAQVVVPRIAVGAGAPALPLVLAFLMSKAGD
jgi:serine kinase of HPr protein (carbohydrate metabolism regulator)